MPYSSRTPTGKTVSNLRHRSIFDSALKAYEEKTGTNLSAHPLLRRLETCNSPDDIIVILGRQIPGIYQPWSSDDELTKWLKPILNVIRLFSVAIGEDDDLVSLTEYEVIHINNV
jgi:hypothetical protein